MLYFRDLYSILIKKPFTLTMNIILQSSLIFGGGGCCFYVFLFQVTPYAAVDNSPHSMPPHVLMNFRGFPPGCGNSVADF